MAACAVRGGWKPRPNMMVSMRSFGGSEALGTASGFKPLLFRRVSTAASWQMRLLRDGGRRSLCRSAERNAALSCCIAERNAALSSPLFGNAEAPHVSSIDSRRGENAAGGSRDRPASGADCGRAVEDQAAAADGVNSTQSSLSVIAVGAFWRWRLSSVSGTSLAFHSARAVTAAGPPRSRLSHVDGAPANRPSGAVAAAVEAGRGLAGTGSRPLTPRGGGGACGWCSSPSDVCRCRSNCACHCFCRRQTTASRAITSFARRRSSSFSRLLLLCFRPRGAERSGPAVCR